MDKMREIAGNGALMPRFNDGMANMAELIRVMTESLVKEIMDTWSDEARESCNRRNGYRERRLATDVDTITLGIPKLRAGNHFPEDLVERFSRVDRAVIAAVSEMVTNGVSTRKVKRVAQSMGTDHMSAGQVSRMCSSLDESIADLQERDLPDVIRPYPGATWQRCIVHLMRNAAGNAPTRQKKGAVLGILKAVFAERDPELVREFHRLATDRIEGFSPRRRRRRKMPRPTLSYLDFPYEHHVGRYINNVRDRADSELKRRSRVVQVFPAGGRSSR